MILVSMVVYWMMILWLKEGDTCVNGGLLNDDTLIKRKWYLCQWWYIEWWYFDKNKVIPVSMVVYWMMIFWLKQSDTCVNGDLLNDDILIKTKWFLTNVSIVVYWMMILWLKEGDTCFNGGLLNDDTLIKRRWYLCQ